MESSQKQPVDARDASPLNYAEYQYSAPEVAPQTQPVPPSKFEGGSGHGYPDSEYPIPVTEQTQKPKRKKILGLVPWMFFALIALIVLIIVGAVVGGVVGTRKGNSTPASAASASTSSQSPGSSSSQIPSSTNSQSPSSTASRTSSASSSATSTLTPLAIISANYAGQDITSLAKSNFQNGSNLVINMSNTDPWGTPDPWFTVRKCLSVLYSYGSTIRTFVGCENDGAFTLVPGKSPGNTHVNDISRQGPSSTNFAIASIVWGSLEITDETVYQSVYNYKTNGSAVPFTNELFRNDTLLNYAKSGVIWYTEDNFSTFKSITGREGNQTSFP